MNNYWMAESNKIFEEVRIFYEAKGFLPYNDLFNLKDGDYVGHRITILPKLYRELLLTRIFKLNRK